MRKQDHELIFPAKSLISLVLKEEHLFSLTHGSLLTHSVSGLQGLTEVRATWTAS